MGYKPAHNPIQLRQFMALLGTLAGLLAASHAGAATVYVKEEFKIAETAVIAHGVLLWVGAVTSLPMQLRRRWRCKLLQKI